MFRVLEKDINSATDVRNLIVSPPEGYTSLNVLESLYDMPQNPVNRPLYELIIKRIKDSYLKKTQKPKKVKSPSKVSNGSLKKTKTKKKTSKNEVSTPPVRRSKRLLKKTP